MKKILTLILACLCALAFWGCKGSKPTLHIYVWSDYIAPESIEQFEEKFNCRVIVDTFDKNEALYAKIKGGAVGYDVLQPSSYMAKVMFDEKMIIPLDKSKLPNLKYVNPKYLKDSAIDKEMLYSVPYMICYACVAYDSNKVKDIPQSWSVFADSRFKGRMTLLDDIHETIGAALKYNGFELNSVDDAELAKAKETILNWRKNVAKFDAEAYKTGIATGEFVLVHGYSGDLAQVIAEKPHIKLMFPKEGMSISCDDWVIPQGAKNLDLAYEFINFMTSPEVAVQNMEFSQYDAVNWKARELMSDELKNMPTMNIPAEVLEKSEVIKDLGENNKKRYKLWDEVKL
ncbi:MAG: spermidine/putrescine ABC transporter substrate-binding protein [Opitutales bacterium]|nr:spermidine/putrescine ABC transporter substrate-binding protein [Opitutales bacterium]